MRDANNTFSGTRLKAIRHERRLSMGDLARRMCISWTQIQEWERGWRKYPNGRRPTVPTTASVRRLADALGVEPDDLLDGDRDA